MENWQGVPSELKQDYAVVHMIKRTAEKELVLLQHRTTGQQVLLRNYTGSILPVYQMLSGKTVSHVPRVYEAKTRPGGYYVLEEFIEGQKLTPGAFSERELLRVLHQICEALSALHEIGVVHRDVKPDNLIQTEDGTVYLLDLDAGRLYKQYIERDTCTLGTAGFAAPEQFGIVQTDYKADIFALGITLNILKTGAHPSDQLCGGWLRRVVLKCTRIDPRARYQTAKSVWRAARILSLLFPERNSRQIMNGIAAAAAILLLCSGGLYLMDRNEADIPAIESSTDGQITETPPASGQSTKTDPEVASPVLPDEPTPEPDTSTPEVKPEPKPETKPTKVKPEAKPKPDTKPPEVKPEAKPKPETKPTEVKPEAKPKPDTRPPEVKPEPKPESKPKPWPWPDSWLPGIRPDPQPEPETKPPEVKPETKPEPDIKPPKPKPNPKPEIPDPEVKPKPEPDPKPEPEIPPKPDPETPPPEVKPEPDPTPTPGPSQQEGYEEVMAAREAYLVKARALRKAMELYSECNSMPHHVKNQEYQDAYNEVEIRWKDAHLETVVCRENLDTLQSSEPRDEAAIAAAQAEYDRAAAAEEQVGQELNQARNTMTKYRNSSEYLRGQQEEDRRYREYQKLNKEAGDLLVRLNNLSAQYGIPVFIPNDLT